MPYPVTFEVDYVQERNRLTSFFRILCAIPLLLVFYVYAIVGGLGVMVAWLAIVFTGHYPAGVYNLVSGANRYIARVTAYTGLLIDQYPSFGLDDDPNYPVRMHFAGPLPHYSRAKTFFRVLLAIPIMVMRYVIQILLEVGAIAAWVVILFTGRMPRGLFDMLVLANSYTARSDAYLFLLTETYPPFQDDQTRTAGLAGSPTP